MKRIAYYFLTIISIIGIVSGKSVAQNSVTTIQDPPAYGKPFSGVPNPDDVTMYQVNTRVFSTKGDFRGVIARLDSIKALGINVIYMMPIYPTGILKAKGSPYATRDYNAVGSEFGTLDDFRALVDGAHKRKMALILDWVGNHTSWDNPWIANKSWYEQDSIGNIKYPMDWMDVAQLNFKNMDMRQAMIKAMKGWVLKADVDGFRCDYADGPPVDFWKQVIDSLRAMPNRKLLFLAEGHRAGNFTAGFDYNFGFPFFGCMKDIYAKNKSVRAIDTVNKEEYESASAGQGMVRYLTNHDVNSSDGTPLDLFGGQKGSMAAFVVVAYMKSVPMIYNGQEVAIPIRMTFPFFKTKIDWSINPDVTAEYKKIIAFRNSSETVRRGALTSYSSDDVCVFTKMEGSKKVLVLSNLRNKEITYTVPVDLTGTSWKDVFTKSKTKLGSTITLEPYSYMILKN